MMADINSPNNDKSILNEFCDANIFANMENGVSYSKTVMRHEDSERISTKIR